MGDSLSHNYTLGVPLNRLWSGQLQEKLRVTGSKVVVRNFGKSGNTTQQMIDRFDAMTQFAIPKIGIIFGGVNDPSNSISQSQTQTNIETMIQTLQDKGVVNVVVVTAQFLNFSTGGDFDASDNPKDETSCNYASVISAQKAAAQAKGVPVCDLFNYLRNRIVNGEDAKHSASWHVAGTDQHFNDYGMDLVSDIILQTIQANRFDEVLG